MLASALSIVASTSAELSCFTGPTSSSTVNVGLHCNDGTGTSMLCCEASAKFELVNDMGDAEPTA